MRKQYAAGISFIVLVLFFMPVFASEQTTVTYIYSDIGNVHRYWYGQGEFIAATPSGTYTLYLKGNQLTSYATDAELVRFDPEYLEFNSLSPESELHCLFTSPRPEGHGFFTAEFSLPYISREPVARQVRIQIEDAARVLYLNGPLLFEDERFSSQGSLKTIDLTTTETEIKIIFFTEHARGLISSVAGYVLFVLVLLGMIVFRRHRIVSAVRQNLDRLYPGEKFPIRCRESENGLTFTIFLPDTLGIDQSKIFVRDNNGIHITVPRAFIAGIFILLFLYLAFWSLVTMGTNLSGELQGILPSETVIFLSFIIVLFAIFLVGILLLSVRNMQELVYTGAVLLGGLVLILFSSSLGIFAIFLGALFGIILWAVGKVVFLDFGGNKQNE